LAWFFLPQPGVNLKRSTFSIWWVL
jgi:hypothetical protein